MTKTEGDKPPGKERAGEEVRPGAAIRKALRQLASMLPILVGVVLLIGLVRATVPPSAVLAVFNGNTLRDTFLGSVMGSVLAGNPINSYVIGEQLLRDGVSLYAVGAFVVTWVTVGVVQLPAESIALGRRFALYRNGLAFLVSIPIALLAATLTIVLGGGS